MRVQQFLTGTSHFGIQTQFGAQTLLPPRKRSQSSHIDTPLTLNCPGNWFSAVPLTAHPRGQLQTKSWLRENPSWSWVMCLFFPVSLPRNTWDSPLRLNEKGSGVLSTSCQSQGLRVRSTLLTSPRCSCPKGTEWPSGAIFIDPDRECST